MKRTIFVLAVAMLVTMGINAQAQVKDSTQRDTSRSKTAPAQNRQDTTAKTRQDTAAKSTNSASTTGAATPAADVVAAATASGYNTVLVTALKSAGLDASLKDAGPYTIFAPSDQALTAQSALINDKAKLTPVLRYHVIKGKYTQKDIINELTTGKGTAKLTNIDGGTVTLKVNADKQLELTDNAGNKALVTKFNLEAGNGVVHVINGVLMP